jgi:hypothetical protein
VSSQKAEKERRRWERLPLAVPIFVRARDQGGKEILEFATALNVSAGGALVAVGRALPRLARLALEIPASPLANVPNLPRAVRRMQAKVVHCHSSSGPELLGVRFSRPLLPSKAGES